MDFPFLYKESPTEPFAMRESESPSINELRRFKSMKHFSAYGMTNRPSVLWIQRFPGIGSCGPHLKITSLSRAVSFPVGPSVCLSVRPSVCLDFWWLCWLIRLSQSVCPHSSTSRLASPLRLEHVALLRHNLQRFFASWLDWLFCKKSSFM